ncbi:MAG: C25 family cysteine peptidase, partial [Ignavibacteriaceae bacterium]|nr:C25 family cysteine peptidase [Ignavibacteriaceae bacterium]
YGGLFISYVGHSGTRTWDNGITEPSDIKNAYDDRLPVVSDNGCSTGKFAEPDIDAFGELFLDQDPTGQAIAYLGNSSLGYTSTSFRMPEVFYTRLIVDTTMNIGEAHFLSKMDNFSQSGFGDVNRLYNYCNILLGDPIIKFAFPDKPNFVVNQNSIKFSKEFVTDTQDSIDIKIMLANWGRVIDDSLEVDIEGTYSDTTIYFKHLVLQSPFYTDSLNLRIPVFGLAGEHKIKVELDKNDLIDEVTKTDNSIEIHFIVYSTKIRPIEAEYFYNTSRSSVEILNPTISFNSQINEIQLAISQDPDFASQQLFTRQFDSVATKFTLNNLLPNKRYYWRARLNNSEQEWSQTISFFNNNTYSWFINHSFNSDDVIQDKIEFDSISQRWKIRQGINQLKIGSAGFNDGKYASIQYNFLEYVSNTFFRGFATALIDTFDLHPYDVQTFETPVTPSRDSLINYLNYLEEGAVFAIAATDEVSTFFSGTIGDSLRLLFRGFGSVYVDSIGWRDSWAMIGIKGAPQGSVPEEFSKSLQGPAIIDTSKYVQFTEGIIQFPIVTNSVKWLNVIKEDSVPSGASINYYPLAYKSDGSVDTLSQLNFTGNEASIELIDANTYRKISVFAELNANSNSESPTLKSLAINFVSPPELAINYQVVSVSSDSLLIGENVTLKFYVYNVGKTVADSFNVQVELVQPNNIREIILNELVTSLEPGEKK